MHSQNEAPNFQIQQNIKSTPIPQIELIIKFPTTLIRWFSNNWTVFSTIICILPPLSIRWSLESHYDKGFKNL